MLALARTVTSAVRVLDVLELFRDDLRVQVVFAIDEGSAFSDGVRDLLRAVGARIIPWAQVARIAPDVVVTASENTDLRPVDAPVIVIPHGIGFHKYVPDSRGEGVRLSGLVPAEVLRHRDVVLVVSHPEQASQLERAAPGARTVVIGDPTYDRCLSSVRLRAHYRRRLGVVDDRRLVVLTSTWRSQSLFGQWARLPAQVLAALPADEYRVAAIMHPNVWFGHGSWQVRTWLASALDAGLTLIPPAQGWQATLLAADLVIGDHGSVTLYAAALDVPLLLATFGTEAVSGTPLTTLASLAARLDPHQPFRPQIDTAIADHQPGRFASVASGAFVGVGDANRALRQLLYDRIGLPPPPGYAPTRAWDPPDPRHRPATSFAIYTDIRESGMVVVRRYPTSVAPYPEEESATVLRHRAVYDDEPDQRSVENASVIVHCEVSDEPDAAHWTRAELTRTPNVCLTAAATSGGCVARLADGRLVRVRVPHPARWDVMLLSAAVYAHARLGTLRPGEIRLHVGARCTSIRVDELADT